MKKDIILDSDIADRICQESVKQHIGYITKEIAVLKKTAPLSTSQAFDLGHNVSLLESLKVVYRYYSGDGS